jgi:uncharacterized protein YutE (UPF0331/DUF86 family)
MRDALVDPESVIERLARRAELVERLERTRAGGLNAYLGNDDLRAATERRLQLAEQTCTEVGAHLLSEINAAPPADYAGIFASLADAGRLDRQLASRLPHAARQRNLLVHAYLQIDDRKLFESLDQLDDLRAFAAAVQRMLDEEAPGRPAG